MKRDQKNRFTADDKTRVHFINIIIMGLLTKRYVVYFIVSAAPCRSFRYNIYALFKIIFVFKLCRKIKNNNKNQFCSKQYARYSTVARGPRMVLKRSSYSVAYTDRTSGCRVGFITFPRRRVVSGPKPPLSHTSSTPQP